MEEFRALSFEEISCDIHCVTKWSKLGTKFGGVSVDALLDEAEPKGRYAMAFCHEGYTTARRPDRRQGTGGDASRGRAAHPGARWAGTPSSS
jgi:DMSO/TMAO reductase YedYZ molybdopterin-dependent catalytic subunit